MIFFFFTIKTSVPGSASAAVYMPTGDNKCKCFMSLQQPYTWKLVNADDPCRKLCIKPRSLRRKVDYMVEQMHDIQNTEIKTVAGKTGDVANSFLSTVPECKGLSLVLNTVFPEVAHVVLHQFHGYCAKVYICSYYMQLIICSYQ